MDAFRKDRKIENIESKACILRSPKTSRNGVNKKKHVDSEELNKFVAIT